MQDREYVPLWLGAVSAIALLAITFCWVMDRHDIQDDLDALKARIEKLEQK